MKGTLFRLEDAVMLYESLEAEFHLQEFSVKAQRETEGRMRRNFYYIFMLQYLCESDRYISARFGKVTERIKNV